MNQQIESKVKRVRWDREQGLRLVEGWRRSGESAAAYCRRQGVHPSRLKYWCQVVEHDVVAKQSGTKKPISFLPVVVRKAAPPAQVTPVKVSGGVSPEWAARFVRELFCGEA